jgi:hypothetical protein
MLGQKQKHKPVSGWLSEEGNERMWPCSYPEPRKRKICRSILKRTRLGSALCGTAKLQLAGSARRAYTFSDATALFVRCLVENEEKNLGLGNERSCTYGDTSSVQYGVSMAMGAILRYIYSTAAAN